MRWMIGGGVLGLMLACGGALDVLGPSLPDGFSCPDGTEARGGVHPAGDERWAGYPSLLLDDATSGGWEPPDESWEEIIAADMGEGDAMWWCADASGEPVGRFVQIVKEDTMHLRIEGEWKDGERHGPFRGEWRDDSGALGVAVEGAYEEGRPHGEWIWRDEPKAKVQEMARGAYEKGEPVGEWTWTGEDQSATANYKEGTLHGDWKQSWGKSTQTGRFKDGARMGTWTVTTDGKVESTEDYGGQPVAKPKPKPAPRQNIRRPSRR